MSLKRHTFLFAIACWAVLCFATPAMATQTHGEPEGLVAHQIAHLFFMVSMGFLVYWLHARRLTKERGWRFIQYAAILLILWNMDTFFAHTLDEAVDLLDIRRIGNWHIRIVAESGFESLETLYYAAKLDHLWCVPALWLLYIGIKRLEQSGQEMRAQAKRDGGS